MNRSLATPRGELPLPAFLPDATRAVVRAVGADELAAVGLRAVMVNAFHLLARPGVGAVAAAGGIHRFMGWDGPVATDSGGFQVHSLLRDDPDRGTVGPKGFTWRAEAGDKKQLLTPDKAITTQFRLGADLMFCLDCCTHPSDPAERQRESVELTLRWAERCRSTFDRLVEEKRLAEGERPLLFAVVQGGEDAALRAECAARLVELGFDGYAYGGWPVTDDGKLAGSVAQVAELVPADRPRFALGIGKPENLVAARRCGYDLFDCVVPSRDARHKRLYVFAGEPARVDLAGSGFYDCLYLQDDAHRRDGRPLEEGCDCPCCRRYSRAYLHHLFAIGDGLAARLATLHNLRFYTRLLAELTARGAAG